jgi:FkbM family methyltransferase
VQADPSLFAELTRMAELSAMTTADRLIGSLRELEQQDAMPLLHYREVVDTVFRLARQNPERAAALGAAQIAAGQEAIVHNLARTVIGGERFLVIDVGASDGWFLDRLLANPLDVHVVAFEPMPAMQPNLAERKARWPNIDVVPHAVGDRPGTLPLRVYSQIPGLSSLLEFETGYRYFDGGFDPTDVYTVEVPVVTLDNYFRDHPPPAGYENVALKIDVQGYEDRVLRGAMGLLDSGRVQAVLIELSTRLKYRGAWGYLTLLEFLIANGFVLYDANPFYREIDMVFQPTAVGRLTEMDCLFVKETYLNRLTS